MADHPGQKWATDVTEFNIRGVKLYLSPIIDLHNREVISCNISEQATFHQTMKMPEDAFKKIPAHSNLILHSDQGWQYQMRRFQFRLSRKGIRQSMSRRGNCPDNAAMESLFGILKSELLYLQKFKSAEHFRKEPEEYINYYNNKRIQDFVSLTVSIPGVIDYYNNKRIKTALNNMSPVQYRTHVI